MDLCACQSLMCFVFRMEIPSFSLSVPLQLCRFRPSARHATPSLSLFLSRRCFRSRIDKYSVRLNIEKYYSVDMKAYENIPIRV